MRFLCIFASILLAVSGYSIIPQFNESNPYQIECGGWDGYVNVVNPSITGPRTIISSYNFGKGNYTDNEKCIVKFVTEDRPMIFCVTSTHFELEYDSSCSGDAVCANGQDYCGTTLQTRALWYVVPANSSSTFVFRSDDTITSSGFQMIVDVQPSNGDENRFYGDWCLRKYQLPSMTPIYDPFPDHPTPSLTTVPPLSTPSTPTASPTTALTTTSDSTT
ncbi:hypothetical protein BsWGS_26322 [Bradybaena similaris]